MLKKIGTTGRRLLILSVVSAPVPLAILGIFAVNSAVDTIYKQTLRELEIIAETAKGEIDDLVNYFKGRTLDYSSDGYIRDALESLNHNVPESAKIVEELNKHLTVNKLPILPDALEVFVADYDGNIVASSDTSQVGKNCVSLHILSMDLRMCMLVM